MLDLRRVPAKEFNSKACKAIWDIKGIYATSRHIPGVRFAGIPHPGLIGTAPSPELLATWNKREGELISAHTNEIPAVAFPPEPKGAYVGQDLPKNVFEKVAKEGARTVPGREHGGNCDVSELIDPWSIILKACAEQIDQELVQGVPLLLPGLHERRQPLCGRPALLSGRWRDVLLRCHRDGMYYFPDKWHSLTYSGQAGIITLSCSIIKRGVEKFALKQPIFLPSPIDPMYSSKVNV